MRHYGTIPAAYQAIFGRLPRFEKHTVLGPAVEVYHTTRINPSYELNHTDIYIPVEKKR